jgi:CBS-domain-containing membrane protein
MNVSTRAVATVMRTEVASLRVGDRLDLVEQVMQLGRIRHLPVLDDAGRVVGILSSRDLLEASLTSVLALDPAQRRSFLHSVAVAEVMTRHVETIAPEAPLATAASRMLSHRIGCLPVVGKDGTMVGLITETDLLAAAYGRAS